MSSNYVRGASITASAYQEEIRQMLTGSGATGFRCTCEDGRAAIAFSSGGRRFRIVLALPRAAEEPLQPPSRGQARTAQESARQRWRALSQLIRAKLDAVAAGIVTIDQEFLAYGLAPQAEPALPPDPASPHASPTVPTPGPEARP
jgi:Lon protease-like protein